MYITFVVDPQWSGNRKKGQGIWCVRASSNPLESWNDTEAEIATLCMSKRRFVDKLSQFVETVQAYQHSHE